MNEKDVPEILDKITDVVLKYRPKEKRKKKKLFSKNYKLLMETHF